MELYELINAIRLLQKNMTNDQRLSLWEDLQEGYCEHCGIEIAKNNRCYCTWDD